MFELDDYVYTLPEELIAQRPVENRADSRLLHLPRSGGDLRQVAHDLIDLVPSRELPTAVAFLEFLRSRRGFRRPRFG